MPKTNTAAALAALKPGSIVTDLRDDFVVEKIEDRYNYRSQRREPHVVCKGLVCPVGRLTVIAGKITTC